MTWSERQLTRAFALLERTGLPAVAAAVVTPNGVLRDGVYGTANLVTGEAATPDTAFDLASLTKVLVTLPEVLALVEAGAVSLYDPLRLHLPDVGWMTEAPGLGDVRVWQLLAHVSGLPAWAPLYTHPAPRETLIARVLQSRLERTPGGPAVYSDLGFITLGALVERLTGERLDTLAERRGWVTYHPHGPVAATERCPWRDRLLVGEVHDENASALGGVSGHAGAFGRLLDVARAAQAWLTDAVSPATRDVMTRPWSTDEAGNPRGLGWVLAHVGCSGGDLASGQAYGHTGFTGTSVWVEPQRGYAIVLLSNRVHPTRHAPTGDEVIVLRRRFANAVHAAWRG